MSRILVSGLLNFETTARIRGFPVPYYPIDYDFFGVNSTLSGVAFNIAKALTILGDDARLASIIGKDPTAELFYKELERTGIKTDLIVQKLKDTPASVVLYDENGRRQIYCDLKDIQETPYDFSESMLDDVDAIVACNINFSRPLLEAARRRHKLIATDVHVLSNPDDDYNRDFMSHADILFLSDEGIGSDKKEFVRSLGERYRNQVIILGMGSSGALLYLPLQNVMIEQPACHVDNVKNTVGAGDALFSSYLHYHLCGFEPVEALRRAQLFAALKIRSAGAAEGFVSAGEIERLISA